MSARLIGSSGTPPQPADGWMPCSDRSLERMDPLGGTAGFGERWFLVEIDGAWGAHALLQSRLDPELARLLVRRVEGERMRPLAIRRTGKRADQRRRQSWWRYAVVDTRPGFESVHWDVVTDPWELLEVPLDGSRGVRSDEPVVCVCTHARHDQCCAVKGRPVVSALARAFPANTWECSHLGGDRFAATMIVFPEGLYYGRVPSADAAGILQRYQDGRVDPRYLRGRSSSTNAAQAAESYARESTGDDRIGAFSVVAQSQTDAGWRIELAHDGESIDVELGARMSEPLLSTCGATRPAPVREFVLQSIARRHPVS